MTAQIQTDQIWGLMLQLPKSEQKKLLLRLVSHVVDEQEEEEEEFKLSPEWEAELDRREELVKNGKTKLYSIEEVLSKYGL